MARTVTYHDPCHLVRGMNVSKEPRELLKAIPASRSRRWRTRTGVCGCGGSFSASTMNLSRKINDDKVTPLRPPRRT